jgi:hypothetical protein
MNKVRQWFNTIGAHLTIANKEALRYEALNDPIVIELMKIAYTAGRDQMIMKNAFTFDELIEELKR